MSEEYAATSRVVNSAILFEHFGYWPNFHDAEVIKVTFEALPTWRAAVTFTINTFEMTSKVNEKGYFDLTEKCQIEVQLTGIKQLDFNNFSHQNVLFEFCFEEQGSDIKAVFSSSVGMAATVVAEDALILSLTSIEKLQPYLH
jgi:hypothetical protein